MGDVGLLTAGGTGAVKAASKAAKAGDKDVDAAGAGKKAEAAPISSEGKADAAGNPTKANKADNTNTENSSLASSDPVVQALNNAVPIGNRPGLLATTLDDGSTVIFRKDFGGLCTYIDWS